MTWLLLINTALVYYTLYIVYNDRKKRTNNDMIERQEKTYKEADEMLLIQRIEQRLDKIEEEIHLKERIQAYYDADREELHTQCIEKEQVDKE